MNNNQTQNELKRIKAKQTLDLPLTERESAILTLFGQPEITPDAAKVPTHNDDEIVKQICVDLLAPVIDALTPAVRAVVNSIQQQTADEIAKKDAAAGYRDRKAGIYDKWYRYNRADNGAAYDAGCVKAVNEGNLPDHFQIIEARG